MSTAKFARNGNLARALAGEDREAMVKALTLTVTRGRRVTYVWSAEALARVMGRHGYPVSATTIRTWRRQNAGTDQVAATTPENR